MLSLWSNALYFRTSKPRITMTTKYVTHTTTELPCRHSCAPYYTIRSHTRTTTNARSSFTYCVNIYGNHDPLSYLYQTCHPHHRMTKPSTMNDDCVECTTLSSWTPPSPSHNVPLPSVTNAKIVKMKTTTLSMIAISNTTGILKDEYFFIILGENGFCM